MIEEIQDRGFSVRKEELLTRLLRRPGASILFGAGDTGKTTLARELAYALSRDGKTALIDSDVGQSSVGPPACLGACLAKKPLYSWNRADKIHFVGNFSPAGHFLQMLDGLFRLVRWAELMGAKHVVIDTTGFVEGGAALELKYHKIEICRPAHIVFLERDGELAPLLNLFRKRRALSIHRLKVSEGLPRTGTEERRDNRMGSLSRYLKRSTTLTFPLDPAFFLNPYSWQEAIERNVLTFRLVGLINAEGESRALGFIRRVDLKRREVGVETPLRSKEGVTHIRLGRVRLQPEEMP